MKRLISVTLLLFLITCKEEIKELPIITIQEDVAVLASDDFEGRKTGTEGEQKAATYIRDRFKSLGLTPKGNADTYFQTFSFKSSNDPHQETQFSTSDDHQALTTGTNVIGFIDHKTTNTIVIGAHYDSLLLLIQDGHNAVSYTHLTLPTKRIV